MADFKFRPECLIDAIHLLEKLSLSEQRVRLKKFTIEWTIEIPGTPITEPEVSLSFKENIDIECLRGIMRLIEDSHVMIQTLALAENYTGERDWSIE